jgi:hypothetical protein
LNFEKIIIFFTFSNGFFTFSKKDDIKLLDSLIGVIVGFDWAAGGSAVGRGWPS